MESCLSWCALRIFTAHIAYHRCISLPYCFSMFSLLSKLLSSWVARRLLCPPHRVLYFQVPHSAAAQLRGYLFQQLLKRGNNEETICAPESLQLILWYHSMSMISMINHVIQLSSNYQLSLHIPTLRHNVAINFHIFLFCGPLRPQDLHQQWSQNCLLSGGYQSTNYAAILHYIISI